MKRLLLVLMMCAPAWSANVFTGDPNCIGLWTFEDDGGGEPEETDAINSIELIPQYSQPALDTTNYQEGSAAAYFNSSNSFQVTDAGLTSDWPIKASSTKTRTISIACWVRCTGFPANLSYHWIWGKWSTVDNKRVIGLTVYNYGSGVYKFILWKGYNSGVSQEGKSFLPELVINQWYHVGITYNDVTKEVTGRVWDATAGTATDGSVTQVQSLNVEDSKWTIGAYSAGNLYQHAGQIDEVVVFNDILTSDEIDEIRLGTYGAPTGPIEGNAFMSTYNPN